MNFIITRRDLYESCRDKEFNEITLEDLYPSVSLGKDFILFEDEDGSNKILKFDIVGLKFS